MLKKQFRLKKDSAFNATYRIRHSYCIGGVVLWVGKKKNDFGVQSKPDLRQQSRVGLRISARVSEAKLDQAREMTLFRAADNPRQPSHQQKADNALIPARDEQKFPTKVGFVVSKKTHKRSVKRNRLKRLMRESYRLLLKEGHVGISQNYLSLIFVGFEKALDKDFKQMKNIVSGLLEKIKE